MKTFVVEVTQTIRVTLDETKFNEEFMEEFRRYMFPAFDIEDHAENLACLFARGDIEGFGSEFIEGYGNSNEFGMDFEHLGEASHVLD